MNNMFYSASCDLRIKTKDNHSKKTVTEACKKEKKETYRWLVCSLSLESCGGCETERRRRHMAWRAATSRAKPCRATLAPHARFTRIAPRSTSTQIPLLTTRPGPGSGLKDTGLKKDQQVDRQRNKYGPLKEHV